MKRVWTTAGILTVLVVVIIVLFLLTKETAHIPNSSGSSEGNVATSTVSSQDQSAAAGPTQAPINRISVSPDGVVRAPHVGLAFKLPAHYVLTEAEEIGLYSSSLDSFKATIVNGTKKILIHFNYPSEGPYESDKIKEIPIKVFGEDGEIKVWTPVGAYADMNLPNEAVWSKDADATSSFAAVYFEAYTDQDEQTMRDLLNSFSYSRP